MIELLEMLLETADQQREMEAFFEQRTRAHIQRVQQAADKIADALPEFNELPDIAKDHDASKLEDPERNPYISLTWRHKQEIVDDEFDPINGEGYQHPGMLDKEDENKATLHHVKNNAHHPEYWLKNKDEANINSEDRNKSDRCVDASKMSDMAIAEMVADWIAMSEELQKNTAREWYDSNKNVRWSFSEHQDQLIDKLLKVFE